MTTRWKIAMSILCLLAGLALAPASILVPAGPAVASQSSSVAGGLGSVMDGGACYLAPPDWICCPQPDGTVLCRRPL